MTFQVVVMTEEGMSAVFTDCIETWAEDNCARVTGTNHNPRNRTELQGQPKLAGFIGPCWGGTTDRGEPIIRYEDTETYAALSI